MVIGGVGCTGAAQCGRTGLLQTPLLCSYVLMKKKAYKMLQRNLQEEVKPRRKSEYKE